MDNMPMSLGHDDYMYLPSTPSFNAFAVAPVCSEPILKLLAHAVFSEMFLPCSSQVAKEHKTALLSASLQGYSSSDITRSIAKEKSTPILQVIHHHRVFLASDERR
jgi:hypothetical protein